MALYLIGDLQGCAGPFERLLQTIDFSPSRDTLYLLGDLVNRGPDSLTVLRRLMAMGTSAHCLLGNHDLSLLAVAAGARKPHRKDTLDGILNAPDRGPMLAWLQERPLAIQAHGWLMVHAGVLPQWTADQVVALASEVSTMLCGPDSQAWWHHMFGNGSDRWHDGLEGHDRWRVVVNALTRLRFCTPEGVMDFDTKDSAAEAPPGLVPWFDAPQRLTRHTPVAFGHWSTLGLVQRPGLLALDTGCVWGGCLSAARLDAQDPQRVEVMQVRCPQAQAPG
jgi:bis(5'-nucleosyl)-tetraphosphatase (symmetrical)